MDFDQIQKKIQLAEQDWRAARKTVKNEKAAYLKAKEEVEAATQCQQILQQVAQHVQQQVHARLAGVVSRCLDIVFDEPYQFQITFEQKRGQTEARLSFVRDGLEVEPLAGAGGGAVDVAAFALRVACLMLSQPPSRRFLILDEPFKHLKPPSLYGPRVVAMLEQLSEDLGIQFLIVQNVPEFRCGKIYEVGQNVDG
jgi:DNA repair exonuclease SbcCD ATPase subunit